jgi:phage-related protein (TIGR01555 family)
MAGKRRANAGSFKAGTSGNPSGKRKRARTDAWMNDLTGVGMLGRDKTMGSPTNTSFAADPVSSEDALQLWRGDAMAAKIIELLAAEALRQGWALKFAADKPATFTPPAPPQPSSAAPAPPLPAKMPRKDIRDIARDARMEGRFDEARAIERELGERRVDAEDAKDLERAVGKKLDELGLLGALYEALCYERAYGGGAILLGANDYATDLREPLALDRVRSIDWLTPLEPRELIPRYYYNNPRAPKFGQPAIYQLQPYVAGPSVDGSAPIAYTEIHESRLIVFTGIRVSRRMSSAIGTLGWGDSVLTRVIRALSDFAQSHQGAAVLLADFAQAVWKVKDLAELVEEDGPQAFLAKVISIDVARSILRGVVVDADGEDFERKSTPMTGFPETLDRLALRMAAYADMPLTKLMGSSAKGMDATGEGDDNDWDDKVKALQILRVAPPIRRVVDIVLRVLGEDPDELEYAVKFKPLSQPSDLEIAQTHLAQAQADQIEIQNDVASPEEVALSRHGGESYSLDTKIDFDARLEQEAVVAPTVDANPKQPAPIVEVGAVPSDAANPKGAPLPQVDE